VAECIFCGTEGTRFPPEHWVSQWISRAVVPKDKMVEIHEQGRDARYAKAFEMTVPGVCPECNHGWMSDIETRARDVALPLIRGDEVQTLTANEQRRLAIWCFLKVITLEIGRPADHRPTFPREIYSGFRRFKQPPASSTAIWIGRRPIDPAEPKPRYVWFRSQGQQHTVPGLGDAAGHRTALVIGQLVIEVIGVFASPVTLHGEDDPRAVRIWPVVVPAVDMPTEPFMDIDGDLI
jgi:hypothetical protein